MSLWFDGPRLELFNKIGQFQEVSTGNLGYDFNVNELTQFAYYYTSQYNSWIAIDELYQKSFDLNSIRFQVCPQISLKVVRMAS